MKKAYRVCKNKDFSEIINKRHYYSDGIFVFYVDDKKLENARVGLSVSKKLGDAVERNKIKRQLRMMFQNVFDFENNPFDVICIVRPKYLENTYEINIKHLEKLIKKVIINQYEKGVKHE